MRSFRPPMVCRGGVECTSVPQVRTQTWQQVEKASDCGRHLSHVGVLEQGFFGLSWRLCAVRMAVTATVLSPAAGPQA